MPTGEIKQVTVQIAAPDPARNDQGQVAIGYYVREGDRITMTYGTGQKVRSEGGEFYSYLLQPGDDELAHAKRMTKMVRKELRGEKGTGFNRRLDYPSIAVV